jgi:hypothetical protein
VAAARRVLGVLLVVVGIVWIGQGVGVIHGSTMTGSTFWAVVGVLCVIGGVVILGLPRRRS